MSPRYDGDWTASMLDAEGRLGSTIPEELLVGVGLSERQTVVDFGCGPGFLTVPAAKVVGPLGRVYAVDIEQRMLDVVEARAADAGVENVSAVLSPGGKTPLGTVSRISWSAASSSMMRPAPRVGSNWPGRRAGCCVPPAGCLLSNGHHSPATT